jgi:hypothetical protein
MTVRGNKRSLYPYIYLRIANFLDFMILKDSIVAHVCIKIYKLPKLYVC